MSRVIIELEPEEIAACQAWHGGQSSMLYACASTGALSLGTIRPSEYLGDCRHRPLTDLEWKRSLVEKLEGEASADDARMRVKRAQRARRYEERDEMQEHADALESIARKCREWLDANPEVPHAG